MAFRSICESSHFRRAHTLSLTMRGQERELMLPHEIRDLTREPTSRESAANGARSTILIDFGAPHPAFELVYGERIVHGGLSVSRCTLPPNPGASVGATQLTIAVHEGEPVEMEWRLPGATASERRLISRNMAHINPADHPIFQRWAGCPRIMVIAFDRSFIDPIISEAYNGTGVTLRPRIGISDRVIANIARAWRRELDEGGAGGGLYSEGLGTVLALHLLRTYGEGTVNHRPAKGGLGAFRLNRVIEYIDAHLETDFGLRDLAAVAEVSPGYFGEAFKASTGMTPFRFILERRVRRAKELLLDRAMPIAEVALAVGFANQSHFTVNFKKLTGWTPSRFRTDAA